MMMKLAEAFPVGIFIKEEMEARGWTVQELARRMGGDPAVNELTLEMHFAVTDPRMFLDEITAKQLSAAFGVSVQFFLNLDATYRDWASRESKA